MLLKEVKSNKKKFLDYIFVFIYYFLLSIDKIQCDIILKKVRGKIHYHNLKKCILFISNSFISIFSSGMLLLECFKLY